MFLFVVVLSGVGVCVVCSCSMCTPGFIVADANGLIVVSEDSMAIFIFNNSSMMTPYRIGLKGIS